MALIWCGAAPRHQQKATGKEHPAMGLGKPARFVKASAPASVLLVRNPDHFFTTGRPLMPVAR